MCERLDQGVGLVGCAKGKYGGRYSTCVRKWCGSNMFDTEPCRNRKISKIKSIRDRTF